MGDSVARPTSLDDVAGWFHLYDQQLFKFFLSYQDQSRISGNLLEMGAYLGKSAILIGDYVKTGETFTVCDLFGAPAPTEANRLAARFYTKHLDRTQFEANYLAFHDQLPIVVQAPSSEILDHCKPSTFRFIHIDASHLFADVVEDIKNARELLTEAGIVVFDDYRTEHAPGCGAAIWSAVVSDGLRPICVSPSKLYATWGDPGPHQHALLQWVATNDHLGAGIHHIADADVVRIKRIESRRSSASKIKDVRQELASTKIALTAAEERLAAVQARADATERRLQDVRRSVSYRLGRAITAIPRSIRK